METSIDEKFMKIALEQAKKSAEIGGIPIGAVLVKDGKVCAMACNGDKPNRIAHAEKLVIEEMISRGEIYFYDYTLYVTLEPCVMCAGLIQWARVGRVVYGASDPKSGAMGSLYDIAGDRRLNFNPEVTKGVMADDCGGILKEYFKIRRGLK